MRQVKILNSIQKTNNLNKTILLIAILIPLLMMGISRNVMGATIKVGVTSNFNYELVKFIQNQDKKLKIEIINYDNSENLNKDIANGGLDLNMFQTEDAVEKYNEENSYLNNMKIIERTYIEPMGVYSKKNETIKDIRVGASIAIPSDPSNRERALILLEKMGVIKLGEKKGINLTQKNIIENQFNIQIVEAKKNLLPRYLEAVDYTLLTGSVAINLGYNPVRDSLFLEEFNKRYVNVVVTNEKLVENKNIKRFIDLLGSQETKLFILEKYRDNIQFYKN